MNEKAKVCCAISELRRNPKITIDDVTAKILLGIILHENISGNIFTCHFEAQELREIS